MYTRNQFNTAEFERLSATYGPIPEGMRWTSFYFDANPVYGEVENALHWRFVVSRIAKAWYLSYTSAVERILTEAKMAPIADIPPEYRGGVVPTSIPSFGFRREHFDGTVVLIGWAAAHGMDLRAAAGTPPSC